MTIYVVEVKGRGVAVRTTARPLRFECATASFLDDLMVLATDGLPLWDGVTALRVRQALPSEEAKWRGSRARAIRQGDIESDDDEWIAFLVALTDPDRRKR
jgi:hypothetical protein